MSLDATQVDVAVTGAVSRFPTTETAPSSAASALPASAVDFGYVTEDGVEITNDKSTTNILAWQGATNVRTTVTEASIMLSFTLLQNNDASKELYFGVAKDANGSFYWDASRTGGRWSYVVDAIDLENDKVTRFYFPSAEVMEVEAITIANGSAIQYGVTLTAYKVTDGAGKSYNARVYEGTLTGS